MVWSLPTRVGLVLLFAVAVGCGAAAISADLAVPATRPLTGQTPVAAQGDWPWWRGPSGDGEASGSDVPTDWTTTSHVRWSVPIPGRGFSSPIAWGDRVYLTTADEQASEQRLLCYDRQSGELLWSTLVHQGGFMHVHTGNSHASATPACDGEYVYAAFINGGALWVTAVDSAGNVAWQKPAGPFTSEHGYGPSPVLYRSAVIVNGDNREASYVAALDRATGELVWRTPRQHVGQHASYATPIVANLAGRSQLLLAGHGRPFSYDPEKGEPLWYCSGPAEVAACTVAFGDDLVFASGGFPEKALMALRADGSGDVTESHVVWQKNRGVSYVPSPVFHDGRLYVVNDQGIASCFDAQSGETLWQERLEGNFTASPVIAGDRLIVTNQAGTTYVLSAGPEFELLATNDLGSGGSASPAVGSGQILLRTADRLYCIGESSAERRLRRREVP